MGFRNVEFPYNDHKLEALQKALTIRDRECTSELVIALDSLYEKYVPEDEKETVESAIKAEKERQLKEESSFSIIHLHNAEEDLFFTTKDIFSLYQAAQYYYEYLHDMKDEYSLDSLLEYFDSTDIIDESVFKVLSAAKETDDRVCCEVHYDYEVEILEMRDDDGVGMTGYNLDFLYDEIDSIKGRYLSDERRMDAFYKDVENYLEQINSGGPTMTM